MTARQRLGKWLAALRRANGMTQAELAHRLDYSTPQFISNWERGISVPPSHQLAELIKLYRIPKRTMLIRWEHFLSEVTKEEMQIVKRALKGKK